MIALSESLVGKRSASLYELEVILVGSEPLIWRRLQVPGNCTLDWLHAVLQVAVGWSNSHLHQFIVGENSYSDPSFEIQEFEDDPPSLDERKAKLMKLLPTPGSGLCYDYDFGDSWDHVVTVSTIRPATGDSTPRALCLGGALACPPEDCGGLGGYYELLKALKNPKHREHKQMKRWLGRPFDPEKFDVAKTNHLLSQLKWPRVTQAQLRKILMARDGCAE